MMMLSVFLLFLFIGPTIACKCALRPTLAADFNQTSKIFTGLVTTKTQSTDSGAFAYRVQVTEAFKGVSIGDVVTILAREEGVACGLGTVSVGDSWQIWLSESGTTSSCMRTTYDIYSERVALRLLANSTLT